MSSRDGSRNRSRQQDWGKLGQMRDMSSPGWPRSDGRGRMRDTNMASTDIPNETSKSDPESDPQFTAWKQSPAYKRRKRNFFLTVIVVAIATFGIAMLLTNIFMHKQEAKNP